jgi:fructokinase
VSRRLIGAVEAGGTKFVLALADERGAILAHSRIPTGRPEATVPPMVQFFEAVSGEHGAIAAFGVGTFGPVVLDRRAADWGRFTTTPKPGWSGVSLPAALDRFEAPVGLDTDVNAAALGEWLAGAGQGTGTFAYTTVGTGIGTGVLHGGVPLAGVSHLEAGHIRPRRVPGDTFPGICKFHGDCAEGLASGSAIRARWGTSLDKLGPAEVELIARYLAEFASSLVLMHMPERLVFGGGVSKAPGLIAALRRLTEERLEGYVAHSALDPGLERYIVPPALGDDAGIRGAIELGRRALPGPG